MSVTFSEPEPSAPLKLRPLKSGISIVFK